MHTPRLKSISAPTATRSTKVHARRCGWAWHGCTGTATTTASTSMSTAPACESCAVQAAREGAQKLRGIMSALRRDPSLLKSLRSILTTPRRRTRTAQRSLTISITIQCTTCRLQWFDGYTVRPGEPMPPVPLACPFCSAEVSNVAA